MNPASQHLEGKLLDYAYGELSEGEAKTVEAHLSACPQCADSLTAMKQVRRTMAQLPIAEAPQAGLESLLAYAQKAAETARARPARQRRWLRWVVPIGSAAALALVLVLSVNVMRRPVATVAFKPDDMRGDWEGLPRPLAKKEAEARGQEEPLREAKAPPKEVEPASLGARAPKDRKGAGTPLAPEAGAPPAAERLAQQTNGTPAGEGDGARKVKLAATPEHKPARRAAAPVADEAVRPEAREEVESGVAGGVVGSVLSGPPASKPSGDAVAGGTAGQPAQANSAGEKQQAPAKVASQHAAGSVEANQTFKALQKGSPAPSSPAEPPIDREREVAQLRHALASAQGQDRARLLRQLCDALDALGRTREADTACDTVVREFPASEEAKSALERLKVRAAEQRDKSESAPHP